MTASDTIGLGSGLPLNRTVSFSRDDCLILTDVLTPCLRFIPAPVDPIFRGFLAESWILKNPVIWHGENAVPVVVITGALLSANIPGRGGTSVIPIDSASSFKDNIEVSCGSGSDARDDLVESPDSCGRFCYQTAAS